MIRTLSPLCRAVLAEFVGTALLVTVVVGSGIAAAELSPSDAGLQLLENSIATALGLAAVRPVRDEIEVRVRELLISLGVTPTHGG